MVIALSNTISHPAVCQKKKQFNNDELKTEVLRKMESLGFDQQSVSWNDYGQLQLRTSDNIKMHSLMLQLEELGLDLKLTKQTLIEIA